MGLGLAGKVGEHASWAQLYGTTVWHNRVAQPCGTPHAVLFVPTPYSLLKLCCHTAL